ncbi:MAG: alpha/beta fold hydrolase [Gordonia sp. (in: high G+C Gram-positive bacteria)]|uniref:alpha/beta fold hydrolase n=1 Tax=Gordonia sp. (in: high G+C Gram-positive bacteria) TaxID=84139 RepID=UPI0039E28C0E
MPTPTSTRDVPTALGTVRAYEWTGSDPDTAPVVLLPGRSSGVPMWAENLPALRRSGRTVFAFDAVGDAGLSEQTAPVRGAEDQARWVEDALSGLDLDAVHTVGHSFGGATAAAHAVHHPGRPASLSLLEPVFVFRRPPVSTFFWSGVATLPVPQSWRDRALAAIGGVSVDEVREHTPVGDMIAAGTEHYSAHLPVPRMLDDTELAGLTMPAYVAIASDSSLAGGAGAVERARRIPGALVEVWLDTTHSLPMQVPDALAERLTEFWASA